jgi:hypothetical protein
MYSSFFFFQVVAFPRGHLARADELALLEGLSDVANALPTCDAVAQASQKMIAPVQVRCNNREVTASFMVFFSSL